jgi:hypothetical protein
MERDVPLIQRVLAAVALALALAWLPAAAAADDARLVLVAGANSPVAPLTAAEVRRLYLGVPLTQNGHEIIAIRNAANPVAREMFLQHVLFMSAQAYERQISARLYRSGGNRIPEHTDLRTLVDALAADPWAVSYMPAETAARLPAIKIIADL